MSRLTNKFVLLLLFGVLADAGLAQTPSFVNFESPQAHSIAISQSGEQLFAVNTPGSSLAVYSVKEPANPKLKREIPVGLEPVSVAQRSEGEVWVVNHLSDSVSVVDLKRGVVVKTIQVGDRPGDIVFANEGRLAFVTSMTERKLHAIDTRTRDVVKEISIAAHSPRTLLASADGKKIWVASYLSGNRTTVIPHEKAPKPPAPTGKDLPEAPAQGIIVSTDDPRWKALGGFQLKDEDVFEIDVDKLSVRRSFSGVGTILFNLAQHPKSKAVWVANTDARNRVRFEPQLKGHVVDNRLSHLTIAGGSQGRVAFTDLNPTVDYDELPSTTALETSLAQPTDIVFSPSGDKAYVASFGTDRVGVLDATGKVLNRIEIGDSPGGDADPQSKRGPRALAMRPDGKTLYVLNRLSNSITAIDVASEKVVKELSMRDPTPKNIRSGRGYLFDAKLSGNGTVSCASCHIDGDRDGLAWDLGDPGGKMFGNGTATALHPMKGPLVTQTLKGLAGEKLFHWRGDRPGLQSFNGTFEHLMGGEQLEDDDLSIFVEYLKSIRFGPNPFRNRDDSLTDQPTGTSASDGELIFTKRLGIGREGGNTFRCVDCHMRSNGAGTVGFTGLIAQPTKVAQLRGLHEKLPTAGKGSRVSGFGFGADGSKANLREFLADSHRFDGIMEREKIALESFLQSFPTETPPIVGLTRTLDNRNRNDESARSDLTLMMKQADLGNCTISVTGLLRGERIKLEYNNDSKFFRSQVKNRRELDLEQLLSSIDGGSHVSFIAFPDNTRTELQR